jgi:serine/threonine-protein kinase
MTARYIIESRIGVGGVAEVFRARRENDAGTATCAVKRLLPQHRDNPALQTRLYDEYAITRSVHHPNIIEVLELVEIEGVQHLAMEYIDGISVDRLITRGLKGHFLPVRVSASIVGALFNALIHIHRQGVLHRDVSAANALLSDKGQTKLTDFGIALASERLTATAPGVVLGKVDYLSNERRSGRSATAADDLFALGVTLERMLAAADPRERTKPFVTPLRQLRDALGAAPGAPENQARSRCTEALGRLECASPDEISDFLRSPAPEKRVSRIPSVPHVGLDGTTIEGDDAPTNLARHQRRAPHRKA